MSHGALDSPIKVGFGTLSSKTTTFIEVSDSQLSTHMAIYGGTGKGKSKFIELILRQLIDQKRGFCLIDPHGDLSEEILCYLLAAHDADSKALMDRVHYLEPGSQSTRFGFDPFLYQMPESGVDDFDDWLKAKVESVARVIIRKQGETDFQGRPRLERFLSNVLYGVGVRLNKSGDHVSLADAEILLDTTHQRHKELFAAVKPHLPSHVRSDFAKVHTSNPRQQEDWIESTIGRLRSFLSPAVKSVFGGSRQSINFRQIIEQHGILLVNLRRTRSFGLDPGSAIGGLIINEVLEAAETASRTNRVPFHLIIDEASRFVGQDLIDAFGQFRKWQLSICLAIQDLSSLRSKDVDMTPKVLSQCGVHVSFQQKHPDDLDMLSQVIGYPAIRFDPLLQEVDRPDGYDWTEVQESSYSTTINRGTKEDTGTTHGHSTTSDPFSRKSETESDTRSETRGRTSSEGSTDSVSNRKVPLSRYRTEVQQTGRLVESVDDQFHKIKQALRTLGRGQAMGSVDGNPPFVFDVYDVRAQFDQLSSEKRTQLFESYKAYLGLHHPYCFAAENQLKEEDRLARILTPATGDRPPANPFL